MLEKLLAVWETWKRGHYAVNVMRKTEIEQLRKIFQKRCRYPGITITEQKIANKMYTCKPNNNTTSIIIILLFFYCFLRLQH